MGPAVGTARQGPHCEQGASRHPGKALGVSDWVPGREEAQYHRRINTAQDDGRPESGCFPQERTRPSDSALLSLWVFLWHSRTQPKDGAALLSSKPWDATVVPSPPASREAVSPLLPHLDFRGP